ncbi:MAG: TonB-dependent receptor [Prevotellaceae bacterium]|jgi:hypothetical protein|nr:TonB-dependent receptor [Prevotellaceae bacterium]
MKKIITTALTAFIVLNAGAQTIYDGTLFSNKDLNGTARFVAMGGAMGALGGDLSTIGTNPAGIGIYRSNDVAFTLDLNNLSTKSSYEGNSFSRESNKLFFGNAGFVFANKIGNETSLRYVNFAFNYQRIKSFNREMRSAGSLGIFYDDNNYPHYLSQTMVMRNNADGLNQDTWGDNPFMLEDVGWLSALGYESWLIDWGTDNLYSSVAEGTSPYMNEFFSRERGGINQYDFNVSFNFSDRVYWGVTVGAYDLNYDKYTLYDESFYDDNTGNPYGDGYSLESRNNVSGTGIDVKMGLILRPFEYSPFRIGLAVHTPTFYKLTWKTSAVLISDLYTDNHGNPTDNTFQRTIDTYDYTNGKDMAMEYQLHTPWTYNVSLGYTIGSSLALGAEYEYKDYASTRLYHPDGTEMAEENDQMRNGGMKGVNTFRAGIEYKPIPQFAFRAGYTYSGAAFEKYAVKALPINSIYTDSDFSNSQELSNYTFGIGYKGKGFYADLTYKYSTQKSEFYPFAYYESGTWYSPAATHVTDNRSQVLLTLGYRF